MPAALTARGFTVLRDARTQIRVRGEPLDLVGIRYWTRRVEDIVTAPARRLAERRSCSRTRPTRLLEAASLAIPSCISGHTHGGQIVLPGLGPSRRADSPSSPAPAGARTPRIFVSRGVGTVYVPIRLNCPPEVAVLTLEPIRPELRGLTSAGGIES